MTSICVFTSTRADYGILKSLICALNAEHSFDLRLFVTGTHLLENHGMTIKEIEKDAWPIRYKVHLSMSSDSEVAHLSVMGEAIAKFSSELAKDKPDIALVLGDRYEALAFAIVANGLGIPLVHLHGGEVTEGALDDAYRHCITKLSYLHFVANETYRRRVIQLGEAPERVFAVGALGVDNILNEVLLSKDELARDVGLVFKEKIIAVTYHPETSSPDLDIAQVDAMLLALEEYRQQENVSIVFSRSNADPGNLAIHEKVEKFVRKNKEQCVYVHSLGLVRYLSLLKYADVVVGNSSSGIIEAPAFGTPTVNIGDRQKGRDTAKSVFNVSGEHYEIYKAIDLAIQFKNDNAGASLSVYGDGTARVKIMKILMEWKFSTFPKKSFWDI